MKARYCPCLGVKPGASEATSFRHVDSSVVPSNLEEAPMNVRYRVDLSQAEREQLTRAC